VIQTRLHAIAVVFALTFALALSGCAKKVAKATPPPPPAPPSAPTATLTATPDVVQQGQTTTLTWNTTNASDITIAGMGTVPASGSRSITPRESTTYTLIAKGPGGTKDASARVTVNPKTVAATPGPTDEELFAKNMRDIFFDFDKYNIRPDESSTAQNDAAFLSKHPAVKVLIEGHCDDRGSEEYNIALGTSRAETMKRSLLQQGVPADRVKTVSYGKEKPFCTEDDEQCWQKNRVDHFTFER
jgi:peptidoglycan-associated lipoprotein